MKKGQEKEYVGPRVIDRILIWGLALLLPLSLLLPWLEKSGSSPVYGFQFNSLTVAIGVFGGLFAAMSSSMMNTWIRGIICLGVGALALIILFITCGLAVDMNTARLGGQVGIFQIIDNVLGWGAFLYGMAAAGLIIQGFSDFQRD